MPSFLQSQRGHVWQSSPVSQILKVSCLGTPQGEITKSIFPPSKRNLSVWNIHHLVCSAPHKTICWLYHQEGLAPPSMHSQDPQGCLGSRCFLSWPETAAKRVRRCLSVFSRCETRWDCLVLSLWGLDYGAGTLTFHPWWSWAFLWWQNLFSATLTALIPKDLTNF